MKLTEGRDIFFKWLKNRGFAESTLRVRKLCLDRFILFAKERNADEIEWVTRSLIDEYQIWIMDRDCLYGHQHKKLSVAMRHNYFLAVRQFFRWAAKEKLLLMNPAIHMEWARNLHVLAKHIPTEEEMEQILAKPQLDTLIGVRDRAIMEVLYSSGIRRSELVRLDLYDVDTREGILRVRNGKGGKDRFVPLGKTACEFVEKYLKEVRQHSLKDRRGQELKASGDRALFLTYKNKRMTGYWLNILIKSYVRMVKPETTQVSHMFRHAFATHMLKGGADIVVIQKILGHRKLTSTQIYTQVKPLELKAAHRRMHPRGKLKEKD